MKLLLLLLFTIPTLLHASPIPDFPFFYVVGHAHEDLETARATISFDIEIESENAEQGELKLKASNRSVLKILRDLGVKDVEIDTSQIKKRRVSETSDEEERQVYFRFTQEFSVDVYDLKKYPKLAEKLISSSNVSSFDSSFYAKNGPDVVMRLRKTACKNAKANAIAIAEANDVKLGMIHSASEVPYEKLYSLIGGQPWGGSSYCVSPSNPIYEVPATVRRHFQIYAIYRIDETDKK